MDGSTPRVSVVIPTYCSDHRLDRALQSLDDQTIAADIEVLLVDDGSPDATPERLRELERSRPGTRVLLLEHSGWPSRPRNAGLEAARGDYVVFLDHDDTLYPGGLEAAVAFADRTGADVVTAKETRTDQPKWGLDVFVGDLPDAAVRQDRLHGLLMPNPHKLYRRAFLVDHGVRFPEGGRVMWEDVFHAADVAAGGAHTAVLSSRPFYRWERDGRTASTAYTEDAVTWWRSLAAVFAHLDAVLDHAGRDYRLLQWHEYRRVLMPALGAGFFALAPEQRERAQEHAAAALARISPDLDDWLPGHLRGRAALARAGEWAPLADLAAIDAGILGRSAIDEVGWDDDGTLVVRVTTRWTTADGNLALRRHGDRILRDLPPHLERALPPEAIDVTDDVLDARTALAVTSREDAITWLLPGEQEVEVVDTSAGVDVLVHATGRLDRRTAALGDPLGDGTWDFSFRNELFGVLNQRPLRTTTRARVALCDGEARIAYRTDAGVLAVDLGQRRRSVLGSSRIRPERATTTHHLTRPDDFALPLAGVEVAGSTRIEGDVLLQPLRPQPAALVADGDGARLEGSIDAPAGEYLLIGRFADRDVPTGTVVVVDRRGRLSFKKR